MIQKETKRKVVLSTGQEKGLIRLFCDENYFGWRIGIDVIYENGDIKLDLHDNTYDDEVAEYMLYVDGTLKKCSDSRDKDWPRNVDHNCR